MLKNLSDTLHKAPNPFSRVKKRFPRYVLITACTGAIGFTAALILLHVGLHPLAALILSACLSGLFNYGAMELWAFPHREGKGKLSWKRLFQNAVVGIVGFSARYLVLYFGLLYLPVPSPLDKAVPLALAYLASFAIGYLTRTYVVFKK